MRMRATCAALLLGITLLCAEDCGARTASSAQAEDLRDAVRRLEDHQQASQNQLVELRLAIAERVADRESTGRLFELTNKSIDRLHTTLMWALGFLAVIAGGAIAGAVGLSSVKKDLVVLESLLKNLYERLGERYPSCTDAT
jgi:hypothetical protein